MSPHDNRFFRSIHLLGGLVLTLAVLGGCAGPRPMTTAAPTVVPAAETDPAVALQEADSVSLWALYLEGVKAARYPDPSKINRDLIPILRTTPELVWNDKGQVLMATWTQSSYYPDSVYTPGYAFSLYGKTWFTAVPFLQNDCKQYDKATLDMRLRQVLGLPPNDQKSAFLQVWIDPVYLFRPCPDPEIADHECQVSIPLVQHQPTTGYNEPPWTCPTPAPAAAQGAQLAQVSGAFVLVNQAHLNWMCDNWESTYVQPPQKQYPWTALGYTYDWGRPADPVGQSEFVALARSPVVFDSVTPTAAYCK